MVAAAVYLTCALVAHWWLSVECGKIRGGGTKRFLLDPVVIVTDLLLWWMLVPCRLMARKDEGRSK